MVENRDKIKEERVVPRLPIRVYPYYPYTTGYMYSGSATQKGTLGP